MPEPKKLFTQEFRDEAVRSQIACGMGEEGRTEKLTWVGTEIPPELDPEAERSQLERTARVRAERDADVAGGPER
jgi:hypothetical protein